MKYLNLLILFVFLNSSANGKIIYSDVDLGNQVPITAPIEGYDETSNEYKNPFLSDQVKYEITSDNFIEYSEYLTLGQIEMFNRYPETFKMKIYPSRRSCAVPTEVLELTDDGNVKLIAQGEGVEGVVGGIPFPKATEPLHHVWNHILRYRGVDIIGGAPYFIVNPDGSMTKGAGEAIAKNFWNPFSGKGLQGMLMTKVTDPPRLADASLLVIESLNALESPRRAWVYNPGTRRVRRAPDIAYDYLGSSSEGLSTADSFDGFNGAKDRYTWKNIGTKLKFLPYNSYDFYNSSREDVLKKFHVNQELIRYELVRVNIVEANLKPDKRHIYKTRIMYFDFDSHNMIAESVFDGKNELMNYRELPLMNFYDEPVCLAIHSATYSFSSRRYILSNVRSKEIDKIIWRAKKPHNIEMFTPNGLKRYAK